MAVVVALLVVVPSAEIALILAVGRTIGGWPTFLLLLAESAIGAWLMRREGRQTWRALTDALRTGRMPARELSDGALVLVGGVLLLTPGFLTDVAGFAAIAPPTRPFARRVLQRAVERKLWAAGIGGAATVMGAAGGFARPGRSAEGPSATGPDFRPPADDVIDGEVL